MPAYLQSSYIAYSGQIADSAITNPKLATAAVSVSKMANEGNAAQVLTSNGAGSPPSYQPSGAGSGDLVKIATQTLAGTANNITFTSFAAGYKQFIVEFNLKTNSAMNTLQLVLNNDTGASQYPIIYSYVAGTTLTSATDQNTGYGLTNYNGADNSYQSGWVKVGNETYLGQHPISCMSWNTTNNTTVNRDQFSNGFWISTADITTLAVVTASANGFRIGSVATLYGLK